VSWGVPPHVSAALRTTLLLAALRVCAPAFAFKYDEHVELTVDGLRIACAQFQRDGAVNAIVAAVCATETKFGECLGHMTALVDFARTPESLLENDAYLTSDDLDCRDLSALIHGDFSVSTPPLEEEKTSGDGERRKLFRKRPKVLLEAASVLTSNESHFMPRSADEWHRYFAMMRDARSASLEVVAAYHAFALHYLQDSFAAGHNGLERGALGHDFDNGFHDDMNHTGVVLRNNKYAWHAYGDGNLSTPSNFVRFASSDPAYIRESLAAFCGVSELDCGDVTDKFIANLQRVLPLADSLTVVSLDNFARRLRPCHVINVCDKEEIVVLNGSPVDFGLTEDDQVKGTEFVFYKRESTRAAVLDATAQSLTAFLLGISGGSADSIDFLAQCIVDTIPNSYYPLRPNSLLVQTNNEADFLLNYSPIAVPQAGKTSPPRFWVWGLATESKHSDVETIDESSLAFTLTGMPDWGGFRVEIRGEIVDSNENFFDAAEASAFSPFVRFPPKGAFGKVFGLGAKFSLGVDELWRGVERRNVYLGVGASLDVRAGKRILEFDIERLRHWNTTEGDAYSSRVTIGIRGLSLDLAEP
jgi:hypothetical protein